MSILRIIKKWLKKKYLILQYLKTDFTLFQKSSILFNFIYFAKFWRTFLGLNPKESYQSLEKGKGNFVLCLSTPLKKQAREFRSFMSQLCNDG